jgi:hypothetical protein
MSRACLTYEVLMVLSVKMWRIEILYYTLVVSVRPIQISHPPRCSSKDRNQMSGDAKTQN